MRQVITIGPDGMMSGLQVKPGKGLDLRQFGRAEIERASEVLWDSDRQGWIVECRKGVYAGCLLGNAWWGEIAGVDSFDDEGQV